MTKQITTTSHISMIYRQVHRFYDRKLVEYGVGSGQLSSLVCIHGYKGVSMHEVTQPGHFDKGTVTEGIQELERQGYIRMEMDETDKHSRCLYTVEKAVTIIEQLYDIKQAWSETLVNDLAPEECVQAEQLLKRIAENAWKYMNEGSQTTMGEATTIQRENPPGTEPVGRLLLAFSVPSIVVCLVDSVYNIVDQIFTGQGIGYLGNTATAVSFSMMTIVMAFATLAGFDGGAYTAIKLGERSEHEANVILNNLFAISLIIKIAISGLGLLFLDPLFRMFGDTETITPYAKGYASIIPIGISFNVLEVTMSNMARTDGNPRLSIHGILISAALDTILDPLYIFMFHWGVKGTAIATIASQILSTGILCHYFWKRGNIRFQLKLMKLALGVCKGFLVMGASPDISQLVVCVMQVVMNNSLAHCGSQSEVTEGVALSAMGVVMKIVMILDSFCIGIGVSSQPILGYNYGAGNHKQIRSTYGKATIYTTASVSVGWLICQTVSHLILSLFGSRNAQFTQFVAKCIGVYLGGLFYSGFQIVPTGYSQMTGQPLKTLILLMMRQLILPIPLLLILPPFFGLDGILCTGLVTGVGSTIMVACFVIPSVKKLNRQIQKKEEMEKTQGCLVGTSA